MEMLQHVLIDIMRYEDMPQGNMNEYVIDH